MASIYKEPQNFHELRILLIGASGVGKSATGNAILGSEAFKETRTKVSEVQRGRVEDRNISVIDTPGFFNSELTDEDLQNEMMKSLSLSHPGPHVFLVIVNLQNVTEHDRNLVKLIQEIFGESLQFIMILFIGRENMSKRQFTKFMENEKSEEMLNCVKRCYSVMNSKQECDANQIKKLLKNIETMVQDNGGQSYSTELREQEQRRKEKVKQEELKKRHVEMLKTQEERNERGKQKKILYQEEETERGDMKKHEDVEKERRDAGTVKGINPDVAADLRTQIKCPRENILYQEEETERGDMKKHEDVDKEGRDPGTVKGFNPDVPEEFRTQMKCPREKILCQEEETERGDMKKHEDVDKEGRDPGTVKGFNPDVPEEFRTQMKCPREKILCQEEETERGDIKKPEDLENERKDAGTAPEDAGTVKAINPDAPEDFRPQKKGAHRRLTQDTESRLADLRIVLLGKTGAGKSSTGNTILGRDAFTDSIFSTITTCETQTDVVNGKTLSVTDSPGLLDSRWYRRFKEDFERDVKVCLEMSAPGPHVFLLVIKLCVRSTENENTTKWFQENLGEDALQHTIILFTHADVLIDEPLDEYIRNNNDIQLLFKSCGSRYHSFNNEDRHNRDQVTQLLEKIEKLVKENGGKHYNNETCLQAQQRERMKEEDMRHEEMRKRQEQIDKDEKNAQSKDEEKNIESKENEEAEVDESNPENTRRELCELLTGQLAMLRMHLGELALMSERRITQMNLPRQDLRLVLLGKLGSGKSSTGNTLLNRDAFRASMLSTTEICEKQQTVMNGKTVTIIDTPPLLGLFVDHFESKIEKCVEMCAPGPHVFLLVICPYESMRSTGENQKTIKWIQKNFDEDVFKHTFILFTWADLLLDDYIQKNNELRSLIERCGGRYHTFNNTERTNRFQIIELLLKIDKMMQRNEGKHYNKRYIFKTLNRKQADAASCEIQ